MREVRRWSWVAVIPFLLIAVAWIVTSRLHVVDQAFLPQPSDVAKSVRYLATREFIFGHLAPSAKRVSVAFLISSVFSVLVGLLCAQSRSIAKTVLPFFSFIRYLPVPSFVPLCILYFGIGDGQKVAVIVIGVLFQLTILLADDFSSVHTELVDAGRTFGLRGFRLLKRVVFPAAAPSVWDHLRIGAGWAWSYMVLSELVAGSQGVGYFVVQSQRYLQTANVFAGILYVGLLGLATDAFFRLLGARWFKWR